MDLNKIELLEKVNCIELMMCDEATKINSGLTEYRTYTKTEKIVSIVNNNDKAARIVADRTNVIWITYENFLGIDYARIQIGCKNTDWINLTSMNFNCIAIKLKNKILDIAETLLESSVCIVNIIAVIAVAVVLNVYAKNLTYSMAEIIEDTVNDAVKNLCESLVND